MSSPEKPATPVDPSLTEFKVANPDRGASKPSVTRGWGTGLKNNGKINPCPVVPSDILDADLGHPASEVARGYR